MHVRCLIAGGGPAGIMLGYLLARAGIEVAVLEKHADFFRDFRGDTVHPSTLQVIDELGLLDAFLRIPHSEVRALSGTVGGRAFPFADFRYVPGRCKFVAFMPQWDFLNFFTEQAKHFPSFRLFMEAEATDLVVSGERVTGVRVRTSHGEDTVTADLVVAADGRNSILRERAGLVVQDIGVPIDALWLRVSRHPGETEQAFGYIAPGGIFVAFNRMTYYQCALVIAKGGFAAIQERGLEAFRRDIAALAPFLADRVGELQDWDQIKLLTVRIDRLRRWWRPGLLCIGDAAHAMSPIGGVGINLAIQDAVAAANILSESLRRGAPAPAELEAVQRRRELPARITQWVQQNVQDRIAARVLAAQTPFDPPAFLNLLRWIPVLRGVPAWAVGVGVRPEHVRAAPTITAAARERRS
jgi:2-polyprenyl-6-methoxyphenol hydroxylase-like FAD-dependent oxidoreductase